MVFGQFYQRTEPGKDMLKLNIGGLKKRLDCQLIRKYPHTRLGKLILCDSLEAKLEMCDDYDALHNEFYFDRNPGLFKYILNFYHTGKLHAMEGMCALCFYQETEYWGISEARIHSCCSYKYHMRWANLSDSDGSLLSDELSLVAKEDVSVIHREASKFDSMMYGTYRRRVWLLLENPEYSYTSKVFTVVSLAVIMISVFTMCVNSMPEFHRDTEEHPALQIVEVSCIIFFTCEYLARMSVTPDLKNFFLNPLNTIDFISFCPFYTTLIVENFNQHDNSFENIGRIVQVLRLMRIFRILKLARHSNGLKSLGCTIRHSFEEVGLLVVFLTVGIAIFATLMYSVEKEEEEAGLTSIPVGWWWATISMTTVGYGDICPVTIAGKIIGSFCIIFGLLMVALPVTVIFNRFSKYYRREKAIDATLWSQELKKQFTAVPNMNLRDAYVKRLQFLSKINGARLEPSAYEKAEPVLLEKDCHVYDGDHTADNKECQT
ncbi:potassium voltage-gated channel subfamily S member 3-like [Erpetoichthys calabaricus]|uniref:potassium voltage-gated channel subfamily S member 3-like n=1 Tax=Erpetoichthys calabaricus TaxID=27687 RepID=UPI00109FDBF3|nr:potassium voltage-gated channel subfamily S member 3-like [Erpetoichthys calabaricus]